ncbi:MAG: lipid-binding SYLF domain-containing protein [Thermodesulfobacteriota bacterium]
MTTHEIARRAGAVLLAFLLLALPACTALQRDLAGVDRGDEPREVLAQAAAAVRGLRAGPQGERLDEALARCRAALVFPDLFKLGVVVAGGGGPGVLMARQPDGSFGEPAFFTLSSGGWGAQAGLRRTRLVVLFFSENATRQALQGSLNAALEGGLALGPLDASLGVDTATLTPEAAAFSASDGLFGGVALDGQALNIQRSYNVRYHGNALHPSEIAALPPRPDPAADALRAALAGR